MNQAKKPRGPRSLSGMQKRAHDISRPPRNRSALKLGRQVDLEAQRRKVAELRQVADKVLA